MADLTGAKFTAETSKRIAEEVARTHTDAESTHYHLWISENQNTTEPVPKFVLATTHPYATRAKATAAGRRIRGTPWKFMVRSCTQPCRRQ